MRFPRATRQHRMFCHITQTWRGKPLVSRLAVVELIAATTTKTGLTVRCELDENSYPKAIRVTDAEMASLGGDYERARALFDAVATGAEFVEFLTLPAYARLA